MEYAIRTVCVVDLGYIGLPTAATPASRGVEAVGVDVNPSSTLSMPNPISICCCAPTTLR
jgi:UDP-N-acetyl-D-mannosaminuronic acid dehydrogenase